MARFPALTEESRLCRDGVHRTVLTKLGRWTESAIFVLCLILIGVAAAGSVAFLAESLWVHVAEATTNHE